VDEPGEHDCLVRASYAVGSGPKRADIEGFALRMLPAGARRGATDILYASTGVGPLGRYLLAVRRPGEHGPQTTLLPVRVAGRPLQLRLEPVDPRSQPWSTLYQLSWVYGRGRWHPLGALTVAWGGPGDAAERFDPVAHRPADMDVAPMRPVIVQVTGRGGRRNTPDLRERTSL
jgi:hypothetical protein